MQGVSSIPWRKKCFENIHLSFLPCKIGVVGVNGAGKSTLMKIMAEVIKNFGEKLGLTEGAKVGYLPQEPELNEALTVRENVMLGVAPKKAILDRYNELAMNYSDDTADEMAELQDKIDAENLWDLDSQIDVSLGLKMSPDDADVEPIRRAPSCSTLQVAVEAPNVIT